MKPRGAPGDRLQPFPGHVPARVQIGELHDAGAAPPFR